MTRKVQTSHFNVAVMGDSGTAEDLTGYLQTHRIPSNNNRHTNGVVSGGGGGGGYQETRVIVGNQPCLVEFIEIPSDGQFKALSDFYIRNSVGFLLVYAIASRETFESIQRFHDWIVDIKQIFPLSIVLVGCHFTYLTGREVSKQDGDSLATSLGCSGVIEISVASGENVECMVQDLVRLICQNRPPPPPLDHPLKKVVKKIKTKLGGQ